MRSVRDIDLYNPPTGWCGPNGDALPDKDDGDGEDDDVDMRIERALVRLPSMS